MQNTSELYQDIIAGPHTKEVRLTIGDPGADSVYDESSLVSMKTGIQLFADDEVTPGSCVSGEIDVRMLKPIGVVPRHARLVPYVRVCNATHASEWLQKGVYYLDTRWVDTDVSGLEYLVMHGFDAMLKAEQDYPVSSLQWPATDIDVVREIAAAMDVPVDARTFQYINKAYSISWPSEYSCREALSYIASMYAGCFVMSDLGELRFIPFYGIPKETRYLVTQSRQPITFGGVRILV